MAFMGDIEKARRHLKTSAILAIALIVLFLSNMSINIIQAKKATAEIRAGMRKAYAAIFPEEKKIVNELFQLKSHIKAIRERDEYLSDVSPLDTLLKLSNYSSSTKGINKIIFSEIIMEKGVVILKGEAHSLSDVQTLKTELGEIFGDLNISDTRPSAHGKTFFTISATGAAIGTSKGRKE